MRRVSPLVPLGDPSAVVLLLVLLVQGFDPKAGRMFSLVAPAVARYTS